MIKTLRFVLLSLSLVLTLATTRAQTPFTSGNIVVFQADNSASNNTTARIIELNPTLTTQSPVTTFPILGVGTTPLRFSGSASTTGYLTLSNDGTRLCFDGANSATTSGNSNAITTRAVGTLDLNQNFSLAATYTGTAGNQPRCATTLDDNTFFIGDQGGIYTNNATVASPSGNIRGVKAFGGTVYVGVQNATTPQVTSISAPSGATLTTLPGIGANNLFIDFTLVSSGTNGNSYDILYTISSDGTIAKYSLVSGTWTANGTAPTGNGGFGIAAKTNGGGADVFISLGGGATDANSVIKATDAAGFNTTINITATTTLYTAPAGSTVKGVALAPTTPTTPGTMRITEYMYQGTGGEFVEFTNVGGTPVDMTNYSYDDSHVAPHTVSLAAFGIVQPGESVILTQDDATVFLSTWKLCGVKVIGSNSTDNLSRADEIHLYNDNTEVDKLVFDDQSFPGSPRANGASAWVNTAGLGNNIPADWTLSTVGDAEGSYASTKGDIGSPGKSTRAIVNYNPCPSNPNAPTITLDVSSTSNLLDQGVATSPTSPFPISGVGNDATDPASTLGLFFTVGDPNVPVNTLTVTASSSNPAVVANDNNLKPTGSNASYNLLIKPIGVGYTTITVTVDNGTFTSSYKILYAASQSTSAGSHWGTGISDASAAIPLDDNFMVIGDDEQNQVFVFNRQKSGLPVKTFDYNANNQLNLTDGSGTNFKELDVEAAAPSPTVTGRSYWFGSMSNSSSFANKPNRDRIVALDISGTTSNPNITYAGYAQNIRAALVAWGQLNNYNFTQAAAEGTDPKTPDGFNIEGAVFAPDNTTLWYGFRAPLVPQATHAHALIAPLLNFEIWFNNNPSSNAPVFGTPIELDLGGRGIRDIIRLTNGTYVISAGSPDETSNPAIYTWTGNANDAPVAQPTFDVTGLNVEGLLQVNTANQIDLGQLQYITDNGSTKFYGDGVESKDLSANAFKKFGTGALISPISPLPIGYESFTAQRIATNVLLKWTVGIPGTGASFDVLRSTDGTNFSSINNEPCLAGQKAYTYTDKQAPITKVYYRIRTTLASGEQDLTTIRVLAATNTTGNSINIYPNPITTGTFTLAIPTPGLKTVSIYNSAGLLIQQSAFADNAKDFSTTGWAKGLYLLRILLPDGTTTTEKLTLQ